MDEALVAFCAVEAADEDDMGDVVARAVADIAKTTSQLDVKRVMVYPYAHLASDLATPAAAVEALEALREGLAGTGPRGEEGPLRAVQGLHPHLQGPPPLRALPFHHPGGEREEAAPEKKTVEHEWFVLTPEGKRKDVQEFMDESPFGCLVKKESESPCRLAASPPTWT